MSIFCTSCGEPIDETAVSCEKCGATVQKNTIALQKPIKIKKLIWIGVIFVGIVLLSASILTQIGAYKKPIGTFFEALSTGDEELLYSAFSKDALEKDFISDISTTQELFPISGSKFKLVYLHKLELDANAIKVLEDNLGSDIDKAYYVKLKVNKLGEDVSGDYFKVTLCVYEDSGKWYLLPSSL